MPYGDKLRQKEYQRLYYQKFIRKPLKKKTKPLKIDLSNSPNENPNENIIDFIDENGKLKSAKQLKKELDTKSNSPEGRTPTANSIKAPSRALLKSINLYENTEPEEDDFEDVKTPKQLEYYTENESYTRNPFLMKLHDEPAFISHIKNDIPIWISKMTDTYLINKIDELSNNLTDEEIDDILRYCNALFGSNKSRMKREYALMEIYRKLKS